MLNIKRLRGIIAEERTSIRKLATDLQISEKAMHMKMDKGVFKTDELERLVEALHIENPWETLFGCGEKEA